MMDILASPDGLVFTSIEASMSVLVRIPGDSAHGNDNFGRSFDLGGVASVRYARIDGIGTGAAGVREASTGLPEIVSIP